MPPRERSQRCTRRGRMDTANVGLWARLFVATLVSAVPLAAGAAEEEPKEDELAQVLVTARFKTESLQDAPISITAITADQIEKRGYNNVTDVSASAPNVN